MMTMSTSITSTEGSGITRGQRESCTELITHAARKAATAAINDLEANGVLDKENIERVRARGNEVVAAITATVKAKFAEIADNVAGYLRLISGAETITLDPTDGQATIARAENVFTDRIGGDFRDYYGIDVPGQPTMETKVQVHEMVKDGNFRRIFGGLSEKLDALKFEQNQIIQFCQKHRRWLRTGGYATFFLFKVKGEFFVAHVRYYAGGYLGVDGGRFSYDYVWGADHRHRVVVPQLPLGPSDS
ncbi:MAG: hypothetical protein U9M92_02025 [Patescibacteria group bacterium]|nr:hypothetical protein [Patescibacteria group bacterium]